MLLEAEQSIAGQEWPIEPGERNVPIYIAEPSAGITPETGIMVVMHGWAGYYRCENMQTWYGYFPDRFNVVVASVEYLQSGPQNHPTHLEQPYDHGYLQAIDAIRAARHLWSSLREAGVEFNERRIYAMGASGGGNITQMALKLAPRTFACGVDNCGMPGLIDAIAYGTGEWGTTLNAHYSRDPESAAYLSPDMQRIRDFGDPEHCALLAQANEDLKIVIVHGVRDTVCPTVPKVEQFRNMLAAGLDVDAHFLTDWHVDGETVTAPDHSVGPFELVTDRFAREYLRPDGRFPKVRSGPTDFELGGEFAYPTENGRFVVNHDGPPTVRFEEA